MNYIITEGKSPEQFEKDNYQPTPRRVKQKLTGTRLQEWCNSIGGVTSVAESLGYSVRQFERYFSGEAEIPKVIQRHVRISDYNLTLKQENAQLKRKIFLLEKANKKKLTR